MTRTRPRHTVSIIALLTLLMAMLAPAAAFADTGNANDQADAEVTASDDGGGAPADDNAGSEESDTSDMDPAEEPSASEDSAETTRAGEDADDAPSATRFGWPGHGGGHDVPCEMEASTVNGGQAWFRIGPPGCDEELGPISFSTYKLTQGTTLPWESQVVVDHDHNNGQSFGAGEYTMSASIDGLCAWQSDLYVGPSQDHAPHTHYIDGDNVGWDLHENPGCFDEAPEPGNDIDLTVSADTVCVGDEVTFTVTNDSRKGVWFKATVAGDRMEFWLGAGMSVERTVTMTTAGTLTVDWSAWTLLLAKVADGSLTLVVEDCEDAAPAISIDKSADTDVVTLIGEDDTAEVTYTYEITNTGDVVLDLVELRDDKIADLDVSDLDDTALGVGESTTVTQTVELGVDDFGANGEHTNVVTVTGVIEGGDATDTDDTVTDTDDATVTVDVIDIPDVDPGIGSDGDIDLGVTEIEICPTSDAVLSLGHSATTPVDVVFASDDLVLGSEFDDVAIGGDNEAWTTTLSDLEPGTYVITYTIALDNDATQTGTFTIVVEECGDATPGTGTDGDTIDLGASVLEICPDGTANLSLTSDSAEPLEVSFEGLDGYTLDEQFDDTTIGAGSGWTAALDELSVGTYRIRYTVHIGNGSFQTGVFEITVEDCGGVTPGVGGDGGTTDLGEELIQICPNGTATLSLTSDSDEPLTVEFFGEDGLDLDGLDLVAGSFADTTISDGAPWSATIGGLAVGTYEIDYVVDLGNDTTAEGTFTIVVEDCGEVDDDVDVDPPGGGTPGTPGTPDVPVDGDDEDDTPATPAVDLDLELVCPDGVAGYVVTATGDDLEATEGVLSIAYAGTDVPFDTVTITLGEATRLVLPAGLDDLDTSNLVAWVTVGDTVSETFAIDAEAYEELCTDVLDEVIDAPDESDTPDPDAPVDNDEAVRDEEDPLDVGFDRPADEVTTVDADDTVAADGTDDELAYTGGSILALLMAGLVALLTGAGLLRRRS